MPELNKNVTFEITSGTIIKTIVIILAFLLLFYLRDIALIVLTAIVVASAIEPATKWLINRGVPRVFSAVVIYLVVALLVAGIFYAFVPPLLQDTSDFLNAVPKYIDSISLWDSGSQEASKEVAANLSDGIKNSQTFFGLGIGKSFSIDNTLSGINDMLSNSSGSFFKLLSTISGGVLGFILIVVLSFYFSVQEDGIDKFLRIVTPIQHEKYVTNLWKITKEKIGLWMQGQIMLGIIVGVLVFLGLTILGVRNAFLFAVLAVVLEIIPLFGPILSAVPPVIIAYSDSGIAFALIIVGLYLIIQQFENHLIYPLVVKKIVGVPPILVILSLIVGFELAGFLGIILSVPAAAMIVEFLDDMQRRKLSQS